MNDNSFFSDKKKRYATLYGSKLSEIPEGVDLAVSWDGTTIVNMKNNKILHQHNRSGYLGVSLPTPDGGQRHFLVHRLVLMAWKPVGEYSNRLVVNHLDGNKRNNRLDNLEWVTHGLNNRHAINTKLNDLSRTNFNYTIYDFDLKEYRKASGNRHVSAITGLRYELVNNLLEVPIITTKGKFIFYIEGETNPYIVNGITDDMFLDYRHRSDKYSKNVKAVNDKTGEVLFFSTIKEASDVLEVPMSSISQQCNYPSTAISPIKGYYFYEVIDQSAPREYLKKIGKWDGKKVNNKNKRRPVIVHDTETNVTMKYDWIGDFVDFVNKKHRTKYIVKNVQRVILAKKRAGQKPTWKEFEFEFST